MNDYNKKAQQYLNTIYHSAKERIQIKDLFDHLLTLPAKHIGPQGYVSLLNEIIDAGYTDDFMDLAIKLAQAVRHHNRVLVNPATDFSFVQDGVYLDRKDILDICASVLNPRDRAFILGEFEGLGGTNMVELLEIREEDLREDGVYIRSRDAVFPASEELLEALKEASQMEQYLYFSRKNSKESIDLIDDGTMLKRQSRSKAIQGEYRMALHNLVNIGLSLDFSGPITYRHIRNCGKKYYLEEISNEMCENKDTALRTSAAVRDKFMRRFGLKTYPSFNALMEPIDKLIARPK